MNVNNITDKLQRKVHDIWIADHGFADNIKDEPYQKVNFQASREPGYISAFGYDKNFDWLFVPTETKGNSSVPVGDYYNCHQSYAGMLAALLGGRWYNGAVAGGFSLYLDTAASHRYRAIGGRLVYVPQD